MDRARIEAIADQARKQLAAAGAGLVLICVADDKHHGIFGGTYNGGVSASVAAELVASIITNMIDKILASSGKEATRKFATELRQEVERQLVERRDQADTPADDEDLAMQMTVSTLLH